MNFIEIKNFAKKKSEKGRSFGYHDLVANHGWEMEKEQLINIIKELDYAIYSNLDDEEYNEVIDESLNLLEEKYIDEVIEELPLETVITQEDGSKRIKWYVSNDDLQGYKDVKHWFEENKKEVVNSPYDCTGAWFSHTQDYLETEDGVFVMDTLLQDV